MSKYIRKRRTIRVDGYVLVYLPEHRLAKADGYIFEHRLIYEETRNCCLLKWAVIHHIDGNPSNNNWSNLRGMAHDEHTAFECYKDMNSRLCSICGKNSKRTQETERFGRRPVWLIDRATKNLICNQCYYAMRRARIRTQTFNSYVAGLKTRD